MPTILLAKAALVLLGALILALSAKLDGDWMPPVRRPRRDG